MLLRTHLIIVLFFILLLISYVEDKVVFVLVALFSTILPDVDSRFSMIGQKKIARILLFFTKHRGAVHSYTILLIITLFFVLFVPVLALPFFLGYGIHLFADSLTINGIRPFYPLKKDIHGKIRTGGKTETIFFFIFAILDIFMILSKLSPIL